MELNVNAIAQTATGALYLTANESDFTFQIFKGGRRKDWNLRVTQGRLELHSESALTPETFGSTLVTTFGSYFEQTFNSIEGSMLIKRWKLERDDPSQLVQASVENLDMLKVYLARFLEKSGYQDIQKSALKESARLTGLYAPTTISRRLAKPGSGTDCLAKIELYASPYYKNTWEIRLLGFYNLPIEEFKHIYDAHEAVIAMFKAEGNTISNVTAGLRVDM